MVFRTHFSSSPVDTASAGGAGSDILCAEKDSHAREADGNEETSTQQIVLSATATAQQSIAGLDGHREQSLKDRSQSDTKTRSGKVPGIPPKNDTRKGLSKKLQLQPPEKDKQSEGLVVAGKKMTQHKATVKAAKPTPRSRFPPKESEALSTPSLVHLARGLGKEGNGHLSLAMLLNMPTTTIINAIYDDHNDDDDSSRTLPAGKPKAKRHAGWMLEKCLLVWHEQTSGMKDQVRMRSLERGLREMGREDLAAAVMECYREEKKITPDLFKSRATSKKS
nr:hypothetical protein BaRGS_033165 [Batillaria attramentaria]